MVRSLWCLPYKHENLSSDPQHPEIPMLGEWKQVVLVRVDIAVIKPHDQKQLWEEKVYFTHSST